MAPAGVENVSFTIATPRATLFEAITISITPDHGILLTHLVVWLLVFISGVFLALRFFSIWYKKFVLMVDDGLLAASWIIIFFYAIIVSLSLALGTGSASSSKASSSTSPSAPVLLDNVARTASVTAAAWSKSAFACGLLGLMDRRPLRWALLFLIVVVNLLAIGGIVVQWVRCRPIYKAWAVDVDGSCFEMRTSNAVGITVQAFFALADILLVVLGYMLVWTRNLVMSEKVGVGFLGMLGLLASAGAIITAVEISSLDYANFAASDIRLLLSSSLEAPITIIVASLPALRLLLSAASSSPLGDRIRSMHRPWQQQQAPPLTPLEPSASALALRPPPRPVRPVSSRSFMTTSTKVDKRGWAAGQSSENLIKGLDDNYNRWNPATPSITTITSSTHDGGYTQQQPQQQHQQGGAAALSPPGNMMHTAPLTPMGLTSSIVTHDTPVNTSTSPQYPVRSGSALSNHTANMSTLTNTNSSSNNYTRSAVNSTTETPTNIPPSTSHFYGNYPSPPTNHRLTTLEEEAARTNATISWSSEYLSDVGIARNNSTRRESPTLGAFNDTAPTFQASAQQHAREKNSVEMESAFEYDTPRWNRSYFSHLHRH